LPPNVRFQGLNACTKFDFGWGSVPDPAGEAYSAPLEPLAGFEGSTSNKGRREGREGRRGEGRGGKKSKEWEGKEKGEEALLVMCPRGLSTLNPLPESSHSAVGILHPHCSATFFLYSRPTLCCRCPIHPPQNLPLPIWGSHPPLKKSSTSPPDPPPKLHIGIHTSTQLLLGLFT